MYLRIGGRIRPFNEADASIGYVPVFDGARRMVKVRQIWQIDGIVHQEGSNDTQSSMTAKLEILRQDFSQQSPDLVFLEDDRSTPTDLKLLASTCLEGPTLTNFSYPKNPAKVYANGHPYTATMEADVGVGSVGNPILEFSEQLEDEGSGGWERVHVGGAIGQPEEQVGMQSGVYRYKQSGTAVGLYDYPGIPYAIWPSKLKRPQPRIKKYSPEILGARDQRFRIDWAWEFESAYALFGRPHRIT